MLNSWEELTICLNSSSAGPCLSGEGRTSFLRMNTLRRMRFLDRESRCTQRPLLPWCFTWALPPVQRCKRLYNRQSEGLPQERRGGWSRGRAAPSLPRLRLSFGLRGAIAHTLTKPLERQHWAPRGLTPQSPSRPVGAHLSRRANAMLFFLSPFSECRQTLSHVFNEVKTFPRFRAEPQTNRKWRKSICTYKHAHTYTQRRGIKMPRSRNTTSPGEHSSKFISFTLV